MMRTGLIRQTEYTDFLKRLVKFEITVLPFCEIASGFSWRDRLFFLFDYCGFVRTKHFPISGVIRSIS